MDWNEYFARVVAYVASHSEDQSTKCGAVVVSPDNTIVSIGCNGFPKGVKNTPERQERPLKYKFFEHSERNCIYTAAREGDRTEGCTMYVTGIPCADCARAIIQAGIIKVVMLEGYHSKDFEDRWKESTDFTLALFEEVGMEMETYKYNTEVSHNGIATPC